MVQSKHVVWLCFVIFFISSFFYYPKWNKLYTEATIGWDVSGYYWYLPATFIYKDLKKQEFGEIILRKYGPTPEIQQSFDHRSGNKVMKYSMGMALQYLPFFLVAHLLASPLGFEADGFSLPYQFAIQFGSLLICFIGIWFLRKILLHYFSDKVTAITLLTVCLATNYLNFGSIDHAQSHNYLFMWYTLLIYHTIKFYERPSLRPSIWIGVIIGMCALTRPTEIISMLIPLAWGMNSLSLDTIRERIQLLFTHWRYLFIAACCTVVLGMLQLIYYKYAGNEWLIYSYQDQTFSWLKPHFKNYLVSFQSGWLTYTPVWFLAFIGIFTISKDNIGWVAIVLFTLINVYIVCSWDVWWIGGRAMVQSYPIMAFLLASVIDKSLQKSYLRYVLYAFLALCTYYNLWWTHQAHRGGLIVAGSMTKAYFYQVVGRNTVSEEVKKLLDTDELFDGKRQEARTLFQENFNSDSTAIKEGRKVNGSPAIFLDAQRQNSPEFEIPIRNNDAAWLRASATFHCTQKEWDTWKMTQIVVKFYNQNNVVKARIIRLHRFLNDGDTKEIYMDVMVPNETFSKATLSFWNGTSPKEIWIDDIRIESFN